MLKFYYGTELEELADRLFRELDENPLSNPLDKEIFVVQNHGIGQWLSLRMAEHPNGNGIAANLEFEFPSERIWSLIRLMDEDIPQILPSDRGPMTWTLMELFEDEQFLDQFENLRHYIDEKDPEQRAMRSWKLASKIADVFDQYLIYRPQMILDWETDEELNTQNTEAEKWQAELWRRLISHWQETYEGSHLHRAKLQNHVWQNIEDKKEDKLPVDELPDRISVFGVSSVSRAFIKTMTKLSKLTEVHFYHLSVDPGINESEQFNNPLLQSMGQEGANFMSLFSDNTNVDVKLVGGSKPSKQSLFTAVQFDFRNDDSLSGHKLEVPPADQSIQVHNCHSPMREVEVLYDQLLALLDENPELSPDEILVMTPDIETYAPFIEAVFATPDEGQPKIPYAIADRAIGGEQPATDTFLNILELSESRFKVTDVLDLLDSNPIRERFGFTEDELNRIERWVGDNKIRWGIDGKDKKDLDLPESDHFTWRAGLRRILLGYAMRSSDDRLYNNIYAYNEVETSDDANLAGKISFFLNRLFDISNRMDTSRKPEEWREVLLEVIKGFLPDNRDYFWEINKIREGISALAEQSKLVEFERPISFSIIRRWLAEQLKSQSTGGGRIGRGVTFSSLMPMRSIPFEVIGMIGMNEGAFPRSKIPIEFDLMHLDPEVGDPVESQQDRYLFLETLLSARSHLYFSYVGQSNRQDTDFPPSVVLREFIDYLEEGYDINPDDLITKHRLQPFSQQYFTGDDYFSYSETRKEISERLQSADKADTDFFKNHLPEPDEEWKQLSVTDLISFFQHPSKYLLRNRLGIYLQDEEILTDNREPFELDNLTGYQIKQELLDCFLKEQSLEEYRKVMQARDMLPEDWTGEQEYHQQVKEVEMFGEEIQLRMDDQPLDDVEVDLEINGFRILGKLENIYQGAQMDYRFGKAKPKYLTAFWIRHLLFQLAKPGGHPGKSTYFSWDDGSFEKVQLPAIDDAETIINDLMDLYRQGLLKPLKLFCKSSFKFGEEVYKKGKDIEDGFSSAQKKWETTSFRGNSFPGEGDDAYNKLATDRKDPFDEEFIEIAERVWAPYFEFLNQEGA
ncbi:exodeoxyribonuclease V subunit gamma [Aliifodinibius salipaludis]|uniref:Exodeoxyribonuclease V subunit gamma n=1 Tax=Fodinibius salipaludis TaxID=2032627 RepID=A0A2A2G9A9_9BACT|nr:exodeoxyribonuclease V subunit gamma [Aliifodinibius salipaludis]PAU93888.1 exodeoxyribonuclease V subunit gamma [Aliifodinibius salipaludis]